MSLDPDPHTDPTTAASGASPARTIRQPAPIGPSELDDGGRPTVLIVTPDPASSQPIVERLGATYRALVAADAERGLAIAREEQPDLIICDLAPDRGRELISAVRADSELGSTPILVLSPTVDDDARLDLFRAGVNDYLVKPFALDELRARVINLVNVRQAEHRLRALRMTSERDRIARDLHDVVIQRLFAIGMRLDAVQRYASTDSVVATRISETVDELDNVIRDIRSTIFDLQRPIGSDDGLRSRVIGLCAAAGDQVGCTPRIGFDGPVDALIENAIAQQLMAVLQEALSNVVRHAYASMIEVVVSAGDGRVTLTVGDDGVGPNDQASAGNGLRNMVSRAELLGGRCTVAPNDPIGTVVRWTVPLVLDSR